MASARGELIQDIDRWLQQLDREELGATHIQGIAAKAFGKYEAPLRQAVARHVQRCSGQSFEEFALRAKLDNTRADKLTQGQAIGCLRKLKMDSPAFKQVLEPVENRLSHLLTIRNQRLKLGHDEPPEDVEDHVGHALRKLKELLSYDALWR
jgi:hypothetical protein